MEKMILTALGVIIIGTAVSILVHHIRRAKQKFVYDFDDWIAIIPISLVALILGALLIFGS